MIVFFFWFVNLFLAIAVLSGAWWAAIALAVLSIVGVVLQMFAVIIKTALD